MKFDAISDVEQHADQPDRAPLGGGRRDRSNPQENVTVTAAQANGPIWLRLTKAGNNYTGEYSFDGVAWTPFPGGPVANPMVAPDFGLFGFSPQAVGRRRHGVVRLLPARRA